MATHQNHPHPRPSLALLELSLTTTYFKYSGGFYRQKHDCAMGSPVLPIVANLYMEGIEALALTSFKVITPSHWFCFFDDTWATMKRQEVEAFANHINSVNSHIRLTRGTPRTENYHSWIVKKKIAEKNGLVTKVYRNPTHKSPILTL